MLKFLGTMLTGLVLDKEARKARERVKALADTPASPRDRALAQAQAQAKSLITPDRAELIRKAMEVHRAKTKIFEGLDEESKQKLVLMAMKRLLNEDPPDQKG
ncbi:MAG: hypothetical protein HQL40_06955 [Alphaproteobacteria bacterium]|nr:hypothetical protein [Alphaproteobacteria bacterium]